MNKNLMELQLAKEELALQNQEKENRAEELVLANIELAFQNLEKENRAAELAIANQELIFQNQEKQNRAEELILANIELAFQNLEKKNRAAELVIANEELLFQNQEKEDRAAELVLIKLEMAFQNVEKKNRANELAIANEKLAFQNQEKQYRAAELVLAKLELVFQNQEKANRAAELVLAKIELAFQKVERETRAIELEVAIKELAYQKLEKESRSSEFRSVNEKFISSKNILQNNLREITDYKHVLDVAAVIAISDLNGTIIKVNANFCKLSKFSEKELVGQNFRIINSNFHSKAFIRNLWETISKGDIWKGEMKNKAKDGTYFWVQTTIVPFLSEKEEPYQYLSIRTDITERKEAEENLLKKTAQLRRANKKLASQNQEKENRAAELVIANKELEYQNQEKEKCAAELIIANKELAFQNCEKEKRAAELITANEVLAFQNHEKEHRAAELKIANIELNHQNIEKENRAAELVIANIELAFQIKEKERRASDLILLSADLKNQQEELSIANSLLIKQEEKVRIINQELEERVINRTKELAESESRFRKMMETIPQIAWKSTVEGKVTFYNQRWNDYTGLGINYSKNSGLKSVIHPDDLQTAIEHYKQISQVNECVEFQIRGKRADGMYRWHLIRLMPIKNEIGERQLWVGTATDIQELKQLQQQKDDFISIASHELKTPLTVLKASLQLLNKIKEDPSMALPNIFSLANKSVEKLTVLVQDLLFVSKMNEDQLHINRTHFIVADLIFNSCQYVLEEGVFTIKITGNKSVEVFADAGRIEQIIINFVNNCIKYASESKEILIEIKIEEQMVKVSVTDKGPGILSDKLPHLFDKYYRVDSSGNQYSGLGLGLYISAEIIKKHNGEIGVDSILGMGSTFWFTLPMK
jgi:PAS domain S-box-containing protein